MKKPIIGISASMIYEEKDELFLGDKYSCVAYSYVDAVYKSGGIPITLPILKDVSAIREQVKLLDGLILSGGRDVDPHFYGEEPLEKLESIFPERDVHEMALIRAAIDLKKPIFAICRGMQILNVTYGGTLYQDISYAPGEHIKHCQIGSPYQATHSIKIDKSSTLFRMADKLEVERVNSFHHQALKQVAKGLKVVATAPDGIIEAVERENEDGLFVIGVQFHPEMMFDKSTFARGIFKKFINICIESKPGEVILKDEIHHREENEEEKNIDEKIKEIENEEKKEFFKGDL
ncbi:gamma-glutamyl-gamma-aminobutyrate hydrolase family protein [Fusobacterium hwasookii]|uniref:Anthranilate synthase n=3 Tax=Fusobacterium hwasookii TaxID=1583098 RepID=A0A0S2ZQ11_9FUSO|nr:gamma-glutamyl-gamma-aminobutyrate hydrolase family protein [Fusobacterium hwasookii]ALQ34393.1 anthranilate synthase [Fusobacterium hwasookii ChDC F206]ALQ36691.1 anthranilate synthase [Fusobacterium hwasookii ChDC F300]ALQ41051.1 anthranilate synthase [Fusobacterium hwasookii ChDC F174]EJU08113.1 anthranilate synthase component II [Fusobacterium hwasookii ChDC F128]QNE68199.1 gamma-glutamyl-gamma-aminobutyrate hydrolase family protein [Fusobacterium hwasookii]